jgi:putative nucleotidyltransferase with HDIG domain
LGSFIEGLREFIELGDDLPTLPHTVLELHAALEEEHTGDEEIATILERDPALTAKLLRVANSAFYASRAEPVGTVLGAVRRVGVRQVRSTCLVLSVVKAFPSRDGGLNHQDLWRHSVAVGLTAQLLWKRSGAERNGVNSEDVYVAGLLHDVGLLVMEQFFSDQFHESRQIQELSGDPLWKSEDLVLGLDHGEIGGILLGRWRLPPSIVHPVAAHHHPASAPEAWVAAARVVHVAEMLCSSAGVGFDVEGPSDLNMADAAASLGMSDNNVEVVLGELVGIGERAKAFLEAA